MSAPPIRPVPEAGIQLPAGALKSVVPMLSGSNAYRLIVPPEFPGVLSAHTTALPAAVPFDEMTGCAPPPLRHSKQPTAVELCTPSPTGPTLKLPVLSGLPPQTTCCV